MSVAISLCVLRSGPRPWTHGTDGDNATLLRDLEHARLRRLPVAARRRRRLRRPPRDGEGAGRVPAGHRGAVGDRRPRRDPRDGRRRSRRHHVVRDADERGDARRCELGDGGGGRHPARARHVRPAAAARVGLDVELFTDPACPFAFSAEPVRIRLRWHYAAGLRWTTRMIVLTREVGEAEKLAEGAPGLQRRYGMPIDPRPYPRPASSEPACRAVVAARLNAPDRAEALLRQLRVHVMQAGLLDDPALIDAAAARDPLPAARALDHKLGGPREQRRYTAPSYVIDGVAIPGFNPVEAYETAIANRAPDLPRRAKPASVGELLHWAGEPLATAEVALVMDLDREAARGALEPVARFVPAGADGYWTL